MELDGVSKKVKIEGEDLLQNISNQEKRLNKIQQKIGRLEQSLVGIEKSHAHFKFLSIDDKSAFWNIFWAKGSGTICGVGNTIITFLSLNFDQSLDGKRTILFESLPLTFPSSWYGAEVSSNCKSHIVGSSGVLNGKTIPLEMKNKSITIKQPLKTKNNTLDFVLLSALTATPEDWIENW